MTASRSPRVLLVKKDDFDSSPSYYSEVDVGDTCVRLA